jgi:hypothetical protein
MTPQQRVELAARQLRRALWCSSHLVSYARFSCLFIGNVVLFNLFVEWGWLWWGLLGMVVLASSGALSMYFMSHGVLRAMERSGGRYGWVRVDRPAMWRAGVMAYPIDGTRESRWRDRCTTSFFGRMANPTFKERDLASCVGVTYRVGVTRGTWKEEDVMLGQLDVLEGCGLTSLAVEPLVVYVATMLLPPNSLSTMVRSTVDLEEVVSTSMASLIALVEEFGENPVAWSLVEDLALLRGRGNEATYLNELLPVVRGLMRSRERTDA